MKLYIILVLPFLLINCKVQNSLDKTISTTKIRFIGEQVIPENLAFENTIVGGLSSIDYANGKYYCISDDGKKPTRFYELDLTFDKNSFSKAKVTKVIPILNDKTRFDPEALRFDPHSGNFIWTSEGSVKNGINPAIFEINQKGEQVGEISVPKMFQLTDVENYGIRNNGTFEGLSLSQDKNYLWLAMELPLKQDGEEPKLTNTNAPVRISKIDRKTGEIKSQFAYQLDNIPKDSKPSGKFMVNGLPEILSIDDNTFFFVERSYSAGHEDGGNSVRLYKVDASSASDISKINSLQGTTFKAAKKTLVLDFDTIRPKLTNKLIDNIEGVSFGKKLANGHQTLVFIADNNFSAYGTKQLSQLIVFEILP
jgi:hypothetical protein